MYLIIVGVGGIGRNLIDIDATQKSTLEEANAQRADALIATTSGDADNLLMSLTAKELGTKIAVAVVNQEEHGTYGDVQESEYHDACKT